MNGDSEIWATGRESVMQGGGVGTRVVAENSVEGLDQQDRGSGREAL